MKSFKRSAEFLGVFLSGFLYEIGCVGWVHYAQQKNALACAVASVFIATCSLLGIGESIKDRRLAPFFVAGFASGSYVAVRFFGMGYGG